MIDPDEIARAARRISAKMVADQWVDLMLSVVGMTGDPEDPEPTESAAVVVVARGLAAAKVLDWINNQQKGHGPTSVEIELQ